jgi:hypothetical protein
MKGSMSFFNRLNNLWSSFEEAITENPTLPKTILTAATVGTLTVAHAAGDNPDRAILVGSFGSAIIVADLLVGKKYYFRRGENLMIDALLAAGKAAILSELLASSASTAVSLYQRMVIEKEGKHDETSLFQQSMIAVVKSGAVMSLVGTVLGLTSIENFITTSRLVSAVVTTINAFSHLPQLWTKILKRWESVESQVNEKQQAQAVFTNMNEQIKTAIGTGRLLLELKGFSDDIDPTDPQLFGKAYRVDIKPCKLHKDLHDIDYIENFVMGEDLKTMNFIRGRECLARFLLTKDTEKDECLCCNVVNFLQEDKFEIEETDEFQDFFLKIKNAFTIKNLAPLVIDFLKTFVAIAAVLGVVVLGTYSHSKLCLFPVDYQKVHESFGKEDFVQLEGKNKPRQHTLKRDKHTKADKIARADYQFELDELIRRRDEVQEYMEELKKHGNERFDDSNYRRALDDFKNISAEMALYYDTYTKHESKNPKIPIQTKAWVPKGSRKPAPKKTPEAKSLHPLQDGIDKVHNSVYSLVRGDGVVTGSCVKASSNQGKILITCTHLVRDGIQITDGIKRLVIKKSDFTHVPTCSDGDGYSWCPASKYQLSGSAIPIGTVEVGRNVAVRLIGRFDGNPKHGTSEAIRFNDEITHSVTTIKGICGSAIMRGTELIGIHNHTHGDSKVGSNNMALYVGALAKGEKK